MGVKIIIDNIINENKNSLNDIQNSLNNNYHSKINNNNFNFELSFKYQLDSNEENVLKNIVIKSVELYSTYGDIAKYLQNYCMQWKKGKWSAIVGSRDKFIVHSFFNKSMSCNIGPYKIAMDYIP